MKNESNDAQVGESRREFIKKGAIAATAVVAGVSSATAKPAARRGPASGAVLGANNQLRIGFIGVGGQGYNSHLKTVANWSEKEETWHDYTYNAVGVAACDLYSGRRDRAKAMLESARDGRGLGEYEVQTYEDHRELLDRQDIDAVFIGTVDHWHARVAMDAMEAGKHVYCEKPMTRYLEEAFSIYDTVKRTGRKFQIGSQYCTEAKWHKAAELVQDGMIGPLVLAQDGYNRNTPDGEWNYYALEEGVTPETMNWDHWLGPVSNRPDFNREHYHRWRKYYPYCAGILGDLLAHRIHPMLIATGTMEFPSRVVCVGNKQVTNNTIGAEDRSVDDNTQLLAEFPSGMVLLITGSTVNEQGLASMIRGNEGTLYFGGNSLELRPERPFADLVDQAAFDNLEPGPTIPAHVANFFDSIRTDGQPNGNIEVALRAQTIISLAEMSNRLGEVMFFDSETRAVTTGSGKALDPITYGTLDLS